MREVNRSSLGVLKSVFKSNDDNVHYYNVLNNLFQGQVLNLEFAKPIIQNSAGYIIWKSKNNGPFLSYSALTDVSKKNELSGMVQNALARIESELKSFKQTEDFYSKITELPNEDAIFYAEEEDGIKIILTEWGFYNDEARRSQGVLKMVFPVAMQSLIVNFKSKTGERIAEIPAIISYDSVNQNLVSDANGIIRINDIPRGTELTIESLTNLFIKQNILVNNVGDIDVLIDRQLKLSFKVENQEGAPVANQNFSFVSDELGEVRTLTDDKGLFTISQPENTGYFKVLSAHGVNLFEENIPGEDRLFKIQIEEEVAPNEENEFIEVERVYDESNDVEIELLDRKKNPLVNHAVDFYGKDGKSSFTTDSNGKFVVNDLIVGNDYAVFLEYKKMDWKKDFSHKADTNQYSFVVNKRKFMWWWIPVLLFFLFFSLVPLNVNHNYTVLDANTKAPIEGARISNNSASTMQVMSTPSLTNKDGRLKFNYGKYTLLRQLFNSPKTNIKVDKLGYEQANAIVPLGFFKRWRSNVYLDEFGGLSEYIPCNGGVSYDEGGQQSKKFDLGMENSTFLFEYYNDIELDIISIYCVDGTLLFQIDYPTNTLDFEDAEEIYAPCRFIEVRVDGESNWGIKVNCPS